MTLLKTALKNFKKDPLMNIIAFVQLIAVILVATVMVSTISIRYRTYDPVKDILKGKGFYTRFDGSIGANDSELNENGSIHFLTDDELNARLNCKSAFYTKLDFLSTLRTYPIEKNNAPPIWLYDNNMMSVYKPGLKSGRWVDPDADILEIVISDENEFGWKLGDTIEFDVGVPIPPDYFTPGTAKVVGILEKNAEIFGYAIDNSSSAAADTYRSMYGTKSQINKENLTIIASAEAYERLYPDATPRIQNALFIYEDGASEELLKEERKIAAQLNGNHIIDFEKMNQNSLEYLHDEFMKLMPVIAVLLVLVIISAVSVSAIAARRRLKDYAKYYLLGLQWKQCAAVSLLQALITAIAALAVVVAALFIVGFTPLTELITLIVNTRLLLSLLGILALYLAFSMIMPLIMLNSASPKELLQTE